jgi:hypothetical protein
MDFFFLAFFATIGVYAAKTAVSGGLKARKNGD